MLVIDAANVIGSRPTGWWRDRPGASRVFVERVRMTVTAGRLRPPVTIVVEGRARAGADEAEADGVAGGASASRVRFVPHGMSAISKENDAFPPLTHVVRNRFPSWFAFPLIFATVAGVSARWAALEWRAVGLITLPVAALGWLIEHF